MNFALKPYKELVALTQAAIDEMLVPVRANLARARANQKVAETDEKILTLQTRINKLAVEKDIDFDKICDELDELSMLEHRKEQLAEILKQLFPEAQ